MVVGLSLLFFYCPRLPSPLPLKEAEKLPIFHPGRVERRSVALSSESLLSPVKQPTVKHVGQHLSCRHKGNMTQGCGTPGSRSLNLRAHHVNRLCVPTPMTRSYPLFEMLMNSWKRKRPARRGGSADHYLPYQRLTS